VRLCHHVFMAAALPGRRADVLDALRLLASEPPDPDLPGEREQGDINTYATGCAAPGVTHRARDRAGAGLLHTREGPRRDVVADRHVHRSMTGRPASTRPATTPHGVDRSRCRRSISVGRVDEEVERLGAVAGHARSAVGRRTARSSQALVGVRDRERDTSSSAASTRDGVSLVPIGNRPSAIASRSWSWICVTRLRSSPGSRKTSTPLHLVC
jgi:hypothetical protein